MLKYFYFSLISLVLTTSLFSQEVNISTEFSYDGIFYKTYDQNTHTYARKITEFKSEEVCTVIEYLGKDVFKIKYNGWLGFVDSEYLVFNDKISDLFYDFQEKERIKLIEQNDARHKRIQEIENKSSEEINRQKTEDSITKVLAEENLKQVALVKKQETERLEKAKQDAIVKLQQEEKLQLESQQALAKKQETERLEKAKQDAIVKLQQEEKLQLEAQQALAKKQETERLEKAKQDTIVKLQQEEKIRLEAQEALARKLESEHIEKEKQDSMANVEEEKDNQLLEPQDTNERDFKAERIELLKQKAIAQAKEEREKIAIKEAVENTILEEKKEKERLENIEIRSTCHYLINEYDEIDRIKIVRTDSYKINDDLTIELFRRGSSINIFFNLRADLGCSSYLPSNRSTVKVILENNQTITFYHSWDMDCGDFAFKGTISRSQMVLLKKSPIKSIWLRGTKQSREVTNIAYKDFFIDKLGCIE